MFDIEYKGGNAVVITTKRSKLISDPKLSVIGQKDLSAKGALILATEARLQGDVSGALLAIEGPGEYESADFSVKGIAARRYVETDDRSKLATIYRIEIGDVRIALIGNIDPKLSEDQLEQLGVIDMVILPVGGGGYTLDATSATHLVRTLDAKVVIPVHFADSALKYEIPQDTLEVFQREFGGELEQTSKYKVKSAASITAAPTIISITRS